MISVYPSTEKDFADNGLKILKPLKAQIHKEDNGDYYIDLKDNLDNIDYYQSGMIIRANTPWGYQGFRLSNPSINGNLISVRGKHLYFDSANYLIRDSYVVDKNCNDALDHLNNATDIVSPFTTLSDITVVTSYRCVRHSLEEAIATVIERWGGHLVRDNYRIEIRNQIGQDNGIVISYAKNIQKLTSDENWDDVVTKILPVGKDGLTLPEHYLSITESLYDIPYSKVISFDQSNIVEEDYTYDGVLDEEEYEEALIDDLRNQGLEYLENNKFPKVNYSVNAYIDKVSDVGDIIYLQHPKCKIDLTTNVIAIDYDCIREQYIKIEFGNFKSKLKDLVSRVTSTVTEEVDKSTTEVASKLESELHSATNSIMSLMTDSYVINDEGKQIFIVDALPKENATNVIRVNKNGIGFSQNGINGTFNSAWQINGVLDMQQINVINLVADMIKGGTLKLGSNLNESGKLELYDESNRLISTFDKNGLIFYCDDNSYIKINPEVGFAGYDAQNQKTYWVDGDEFHQRKSVVEEEITLAQKARIIPITVYDNNNNVTNDGVGFVALV